MSRESRRSLRAKHEMNRQLVKFAQQQIEEFINPNAIDKEIDSFITEQEEYERMYAEDVMLGLFDDYEDVYDAPYEDEEYEDIYDVSYDDYDDYDDYDIIGYSDNSRNDWRNDYCYYEVGSYYKDSKNKTYLCAKVKGDKVLIDIHTGLEAYPHELSKVG